MTNQARPANFKAISEQDYASLDPKTKDALVKARHEGILRFQNEKIVAALRAELEKTQLGPGGLPVPLHRPSDLAVSMLAITEPLFLEGLQAHPDGQKVIEAFKAAGREMTIDVVDRNLFAQHLRNFRSSTFEGLAIYEDAGKEMSKDPGETHVYVAIFDAGKCTVFNVELMDPEEAKRREEQAEADRNVIHPEE